MEVADSPPPGSAIEAPLRSAGAVPLIDVIVPTRNRPDDLRRMLPTVAAQSHRNFRLVVVDQSDDPRPNADAMREFASDRMLHLPRTQKGKSGALNHALSLTSAPIIAFTDDDCTLPQDWLARIHESLAQHPRAGIVFGDVQPIDCDPAEWFVPAIAFERIEVLRGPVLRSPGTIGLGANMAVRRDVFARIGLFDEDLGPGGRLITGEECELALRALSAGIDVVRDPSFNVLHWGARPVAGGAARDLVNFGFFALGAGYGKHLRGGDWRAAAVVGHETAIVAQRIAAAALRRQRPLHLRRLAMLWKGIAMGFQRGPRIPRLNGRG
jgi:glycosyltransferase involved in cell wall biosynthesis